MRARIGRMPTADALLDVIGGFGAREDRIRHIRRLPARAARTAPWPAEVHPEVRRVFEEAGMPQLWSHQAQAAGHAFGGRHTVIATGTASGKSAGFLLPSLSSIMRGLDAPDGRGATVLYLAPTKALAADQLSTLEGIRLRGLRAARLDGDASQEDREWIRKHANYVLTNPDILHSSVLPGHARWSALLRRCTHVIVDECHHYRGMFGSHVALVLRRLLRLLGHYGATPVVLGASATIAEPAESFSRLIGADCEAVTEDGSPRPAGAFVLWEPPQLPGLGEHGAPARRGVIGEAASALTDLICAGARSIAFVRSRGGAEAIADMTRRLLADVDADLTPRVAAYRGGYLPEERRLVEEALRSGRLLGVASTNALELGIDISGLDTVIIGGWPGTRASLWQQAGRAGRGGGRAADGEWAAVLIARDDPLDTYLVHHPGAIFDAPVEACVFDPGNPHVQAGHLLAAAEELPLTEEAIASFGPHARILVDTLTERGFLRRRPAGWFWTKRERASALTSIRSSGGTIRLVESDTGTLIGTVDEAAAHAQAHAGAVYVHQGRTYLVDELDLDGKAALLTRGYPDFTTQARNVTDIRIARTEWTRRWDSGVSLHFGAVEVSDQVVSFQRRQLVSNQLLSEEPLELPARELLTRAVWWTLPEHVLETAGIDAADVPGAVHAAEHAAIGILPLFATCDRWDIGGVSTARHADTGQATIFIYDGHPGGAGFAEHGAGHAPQWLQATAEAIEACECVSGCPSCVQSPKCGNGNEPLDKDAALALLRTMLSGHRLPPPQQ